MYKSTSLFSKKIKELNFLGFALHLAGDTFSHQYVIAKSEFSKIYNNKRIERLNGKLLEKPTQLDFLQTKLF